MRRAIVSISIASALIQPMLHAQAEQNAATRPEAKAKIYALCDSLPVEAAAPDVKPKRQETLALSLQEPRYAAELNNAMVEALLIEPSDLRRLALTLDVLSVKAPGESKLEIESLDGGIGGQAKGLVLSVPCKSLEKGWNSFDLKKAYEERSGAGKGRFAVSIKLAGASKETRVELAPLAFDYDSKKKLSYFSMDYLSRPSERLFEQGVVPTEGVYAQVVDGKIVYGGKRLKLWGVCRHDSENLFTADRIRKLGFNAIRIWGPRDTGWHCGIEATEACAIKDAPEIDRFDRFFAECKKQGLFVMFPSLHQNRFSQAIFDDSSFLRGVGAGDKDWADWKQGMADFKKEGLNYSWLQYFDERFREYSERHAKGVLSHVNPYTGKPYSQEEAICIYEINNENGFIQWMAVSDRIDKLPGYFKAKLQCRWNLWLKERYASDSRLKDAWGSLQSGESLERGSCELGPTIKAVSTLPKARGEDFLRFLLDLVLDYNKSMAALIRSSAPKGVGSNVAPIIADTQFIKNIPWLYADATVCDTVSFGIYPFTLSSSLTNPPSLYVMDHLTVKGKATVIYEFNVGRPNPYRTEYVYKAALLASWQDWDGVFFHYYSEPRGHGLKEGPDALTPEEFLSSRQLTPTPWDKASNVAGDNSFSDGVDIAKHSASALAGRLFMGMAVKPAPKPTLFSVGMSGVDSFDFIRGIPELNAATTFQEGSRICFDASQKEPLKIFGQREEKAAQGPVSWNGGEVVWDRDNGRLVVDAPSVKAYVGKPAPYKFKDGIAFSGVDAPFIAFGIVAEDGTPILEAKPGTKLILSVVSDSQNQGFEVDLSGIADGGPFVHPLELGKRTKAVGLPPSSLTPVKFLLSFPRSFDGELRNYDYAMRLRDARELAMANEIAFPNSYASYVSILRVAKWGGGAVARVIAQERKETAAVSSVRKDLAKTELWCPVPLIDWNSCYAWAHQSIRDGSVPFASISKFDGEEKALKSIAVTEMQVMKDATANVSLSFESDALTRIDLEFVNPPPFGVLVDFCKSKIQRKPIKEEIVSSAAITSSVEWEFVDSKSGRRFSAVAKELQGVVSASFSLK